MATARRAKETVQIAFREVNASGVFIAQTEANQKNSMSLLKQNGLRPLTYQEAIIKIDQNPELKEQLKGKWFYLDGKGSQLLGYYTFNDKGEFTQGKGDIEKTVYVYKGSQPMSLDVYMDDDAFFSERRFLLYANDGPHYVASVVVGVPAGHEMATPKIEAPNSLKVDSELVSEFRSVIAKMDSATQVGVLNAEITEVAKKVLRAIE